VRAKKPPHPPRRAAVASLADITVVCRTKTFSVRTRCNLVVGVRAAVLDDHESIVRVGAMAHGRQDDAAGRDAGQDQRIDPPGAQDHLEVGAGERAHAVLDHDDVALGRSHRGRDCPSRASRARSARSPGPPKTKRFARSTSGLAGPETDHDVDDRQLGGPRGVR